MLPRRSQAKRSRSRRWFSDRGVPPGVAARRRAAREGGVFTRARQRCPYSGSAASAWNTGPLPTPTGQCQQASSVSAGSKEFSTIPASDRAIFTSAASVLASQPGPVLSDLHWVESRGGLLLVTSL